MAPLEKWKNLKGIVNCGDNYSVSNLGRIKNDLTGKIRKLKPNHGYWRVVLSHEGATKTYPVHRLVLLAFSPIENPEKYQVNHKDENPSNNELSNLEWKSHIDNQNYGTRNQRISESKKGDKNPMKRQEVVAKKCKKVTAYKNGKFVGTFNSLKECSEITGVAKNRISQICSKGGITRDGYTFHLGGGCHCTIMESESISS